MKTSKKILAIISCTFLLFPLNAFTQNNALQVIRENNISIDTFTVVGLQGKTHHSYKLSYDEFISCYGVDDTSVAIIDIFFDKRENLAAGKMSMLPVSAVVAFAAPTVGVSLMLISSPLFISGTVTRIKYNRKRLINALVCYQSNNKINFRLKKKIDAYLMNQQELFQEQMLENQLVYND